MSLTRMATSPFLYILAIVHNVLKGDVETKHPSSFLSVSPLVFHLLQIAISRLSEDFFAVLLVVCQLLRQSRLTLPQIAFVVFLPTSFGVHLLAFFLVFQYICRRS